MRGCEPLSGAERRLIRGFGMALVGVYVLSVGLFALLKVRTYAFQAQAWAEVVYGPAITVGCAYLLFLAALWVERRAKG